MEGILQFGSAQLGLGHERGPSARLTSPDPGKPFRPMMLSRPPASPPAIMAWPLSVNAIAPIGADSAAAARAAAATPPLAAAAVAFGTRKLYILTDAGKPRQPTYKGVCSRVDVDASTVV